MPAGKISPNLTWEDARCRCGTCDGWGDLAMQDEIARTARWAEEVRAALGNVPLLVLRFYCCENGDFDDGAHRKGRALDVTTASLSPSTVQKIFVARWPDLVKGLGSFRGYTHIDRRDGEPARWRG